MLNKILLILVIPALLLAAGCSLVESGSAPEQSPAEEQPAAGGTIVIEVETEPTGQAGAFTFTGVPSGTLSSDANLVVTDLEPGTYTTTAVDPAPDFDVTGAECSDGSAGLASSADPQTRTAVVNLDAGETVTCTFTNTQRATAVIASETEPDAVGGQFLFTGVPSGTIPAGGTLVIAELRPGTYTSTQADPAPEFDLMAINCDDGGSATISQGDPGTRSAIFQLDPGEMVTCTYTNTRRGTAVVAAAGDSCDDPASFLFTGVPSGTIPACGTLVVADLSPGTYTTTLADPQPEDELTEIQCDDQSSTTTSAGDASTRSAIYNIDPGETVTCTFLLESADGAVEEGGQSAASGPGAANEPGAGNDAEPATGGENPFEKPDPDFENFPLPEKLPDGAGSDLVPLPGPWSGVNFAGQMDCGAMSLPIPAQPPEGGTIDVQDGGATIVGRGLSPDTADITVTADPDIAGRYAGAFEATEQGTPIVIDYYWQVITEEYIVGYLTSDFTAEGVTCSIYRPFELRYAG